jgi:hypothetical protein
VAFYPSPRRCGDTLAGNDSIRAGHIQFRGRRHRILAEQVWWRPLVIASAAFSAALILLFWDGGVQMIVEKGLVGLLINLALLVALLVFRSPPSV